MSTSSTGPALSSLAQAYPQTLYARAPYIAAGFPTAGPLPVAGGDGASLSLGAGDAGAFQNDAFSQSSVLPQGPDFNRLINLPNYQIQQAQALPVGIDTSGAPEGFPSSEAFSPSQAVTSPFTANPNGQTAAQSLQSPANDLPEQASYSPSQPFQYPGYPTQAYYTPPASSNSPAQPSQQAGPKARDEATDPETSRPQRPSRQSSEQSRPSRPSTNRPSSGPRSPESRQPQARQPQRNQSAEAYAEQVGDKVGDQVSEFLKDNPDWAKTLDQMDSREDIQKMLKDPNSPPNDFLRRLYDNRFYRWSAPVLRFIGRIVVMFLPQNVKEDAKLIIKWATTKPPEATSSSRSRSSSSFDRAFDSDFDSDFDRPGRSSSSSRSRSRDIDAFDDDFDSDFDSDFDRPGRSSGSGSLSDRVRDQVSSLSDRTRRAWDDSEF
ncbi:MAG: hypothetical protein VKJ04_08310 [Vampirovibrionales bacterium]|nr:hypothetical protein [Vampirovibrionales bacterium]